MEFILTTIIYCYPVCEIILNLDLIGKIVMNIFKKISIVINLSREKYY